MSDNVEVIAVSVTSAPTVQPAPKDKPSAWQKMRASMVNDTKTALIVFLIGTNFITGYNYLAAAVDDPRDYVTYNGSFGPMAYAGDGKLSSPAYGAAQSVFHAGEKVSFVTNLCVAPGVSITGRAELVRTAQKGVPETVIDRRVTDVPPSMHRCGPKIGSFEFAADALPGTYEIRRSVSVDGETSTLRQWWPLKLQLEPLDVELVATTRTVPNDRALAPTSSTSEDTSTVSK